MTKFDKKLFVGTEYVTYEGKFVARFKRGGKAHFLKFLVANFTVDEYFGMLETIKTPLGVLKTKGYISQNTAKALEYAGYPVTPEGEARYFVDIMKKYSTFEKIEAAKTEAINSIL